MLQKAIAAATTFVSALARFLTPAKQLLIALVLFVPTCATAASDEKSESTTVTQVREELWGIPGPSGPGFGALRWACFVSYTKDPTSFR